MSACDTAASSAPKRIGIAVVEQDGRYLVGTRGPDGPLPGYAEFPGGKCLPDETAEACAIRECREESGLNVTVQELLLRCPFVYPHAAVDLHFFLCHPQAPEPADCRGYRWVPVHELETMKFPEANAPVIRMLLR